MAISLRFLSPEKTRVCAGARVGLVITFTMIAAGSHFSWYTALMRAAVSCGVGTRAVIVFVR